MNTLAPTPEVIRPSTMRLYVLTVLPGQSAEMPVNGNFFYIVRSSVGLQLTVKSNGYADDTLYGERGFGMVDESRDFNKVSFSQAQSDTSPRDVPYQVEVLAGYKNKSTRLFFSSSS